MRVLCFLAVFFAAIAFAPAVSASELTVHHGETIVVYGDRGNSCTTPKSFSWVVDNALEYQGAFGPSSGELSDGGIGLKESGRCGKEVKVRIILYTPNPGATEDKIRFWDEDPIKITVLPAAEPSPNVLAVSGQPVEVYRDRGNSCSDAPSFDWVVGRALSYPGAMLPAHGQLSDGGVGLKESGQCGKEVPVRIVLYTSEPGYVGTDSIRFWDDDPIHIGITSQAANN